MAITENNLDYKSMISEISESDVYADAEWTVPSYGRCRMLETDSVRFMASGDYETRRGILLRYLKNYPWHGNGKHKLPISELEKTYPKAYMESTILAQAKTYRAMMSFSGKTQYRFLLSQVGYNDVLTLDETLYYNKREDGTPTNPVVVSHGNVLKEAIMPTPPVVTNKALAAEQTSTSTTTRMVPFVASAVAGAAVASGAVSRLQTQFASMASNIRSLIAAAAAMPTLIAGLMSKVSQYAAAAAIAAVGIYTSMVDLFTTLKEKLVETIEEMVEKLSALMEAAGTGGGGGDGTNSSQFLWKPVSESNGKLVVLVPWQVSTPPVGSLTVNGESLTYTSTANGNRAHYRAGKPGSAYGNNVKVVLSHKGSKYNWTVPSGGSRYTSA